MCRYMELFVEEGKPVSGVESERDRRSCSPGRHCDEQTKLLRLVSALFARQIEHPTYTKPQFHEGAWVGLLGRSEIGPEGEPSDGTEAEEPARVPLTPE